MATSQLRDVVFRMLHGHHVAVKAVTTPRYCRTAEMILVDLATAAVAAVAELLGKMMVMELMMSR